MPESCNIMKIKIIKKTPFGPVVLLWTLFDDNPVIVRIILSNPQFSAENLVHKLYPNSIQSSCAEIDNLALDIKSFLEGEKIVFALDNIALENCSEFQYNVLMTEYRISWGSVGTYQLIARYLGNEKASRAVGNALARNPFPIIIPCHRAIRSDGSIGGFQGGADMKRALLENEGIIFDGKGKVPKHCLLNKI